MRLTIRDQACYRKRALFGDALPVEVTEGDTIGLIKEKIHGLSGVPVEDQILFYEGIMQENPRLAAVGGRDQR